MIFFLLMKRIKGSFPPFPLFSCDKWDKAVFLQYYGKLRYLAPEIIKKRIMELTLIETNAYLELKRRLSALSVQMADFQKKIVPPSPEK